MSRPRWLVAAVVASYAALIVAAIVASLAAVSCAAAKAPAGSSCREKGLAIINNASSCNEAVKALGSLIRRDPSCIDYFGPDAAAEQTCAEGGAR